MSNSRFWITPRLDPSLPLERQQPGTLKARYTALVAQRVVMAEDLKETDEEIAALAKVLEKYLETCAVWQASPAA